MATGRVNEGGGGTERGVGTGPRVGGETVGMRPKGVSDHALHVLVLGRRRLHRTHLLESEVTLPTPGQVQLYIVHTFIVHVNAYMV